MLYMAAITAMVIYSSGSNAFFAVSKPIATAEAASYKACTASDIESSAVSADHNGIVVTTFLLKARAGITCQVNGFPSVLIGTTKYFFPITTKASGIAHKIVINAKQKTTFTVVWNNWCGENKANLIARIVLPKDTGYLQIPLMTSLGAMSNAMPQCSFVNSASFATITSFTK